MVFLAGRSLALYTGRPYREDNFRHVFAELRANAKLPDRLRFADLRRSGMTEGGDAGATEDELRGQSGHADRHVVSVCVRSTPKQAGNAVAERVAARDRTFWKVLSEWPVGTLSDDRFRSAPKLLKLQWWAHQDSNLGPAD